MNPYDFLGGKMVLVSIVGDFHSSILPITYEFREEMDKHIIVYDDSKADRQQAERIIRGQRAFMERAAKSPKEHYEIETICIDEDSYGSIVGALEKIKQYADRYSDIYLNTTDGLSSIAIVLSSSLLDLGARVISYDRYANTYNLHSTKGMQKHPIRHNMDIRSHLLLKGYMILSEPDSDAIAGRKASILALTEDLAEYKHFVNHLSHAPLDNFSGYNRYKEIFERIGIKNQKFIQGTVFEEYIYHLIVDHFDFDDVWAGAHVSFEEGVSNEFDILMIKDNHLHTIECKFTNYFNGGHFVYKTELIMDYLDDDGRAMILSIGGENRRKMKNGKRKVQFSQGDMARARYGNIAIHQSSVFDKEAFLDHVRRWFIAYES
jgi:hypothetical protein